MLDIMTTKITSLGIEDWFKDIDHISLMGCRSRPSKISTFSSEAANENFPEQNIRTIQRGIEFARLVEKGTEPSVAVKSAWSRFPLLDSESIKSNG